MRENITDTDMLLRGTANLPRVLDIMGFPSLRKGQDTVIAQIMGGRDVLCILPTSTGKTGCFVIPTLALGWKTLVFSPLIALMRDQVQSLQRKGIRAGQMVSVQSEAENIQAMRLWMAGELDLFYVAPERLGNEHFRQAMQAVCPDFVVADEAHVVSEWSDNFRSAYAHVGDFIEEFNPRVVGTFTATMPPEVERDVRRVFRQENAEKILWYPRRANLNLSADLLVGIHQLVQDVKSVQGACIIYCSTIERVQQRAAILSDMLGEEVGIYHGTGMTPTQKKSNMDNFMEGRVRIIVATNAFGMGIDKSDIRGVFSADMPRSCEEVAQLNGRAGRDGKPSFCKTYWDSASRRTQEFFISNGHPGKADITALYQAIQRMADRDGTLHKGSADLSRASGVKGFLVGAAKQVLMASKVLEAVSVDAEEKACLINYKGSSEEELFREWRGYVESTGREENGYRVISQGDLEQLCEAKMPVIRKKFKQWEDEGLVAFLPPSKARPVKLIGDISMVDFPRLKQKAVEAYEKLDKVAEYIETPDGEKHKFLEDYFGVTNNGG